MTDQTPIPPWYKQFWPWFLIALPMTAVIASMVTINLAITDTDGLVKDDYYKEGLAVNADTARKKMAESLGVQAYIIIVFETGAVNVEMNDAPIGTHEEMTLKMIHPTRAHNDINITLKAKDEKTFTGKIDASLLAGNWWVRLSPSNDSWYIQNRLLVPNNNQVWLQ